MASKELLGLRVAVYARFSSEGQREASIDDQLRRCHEFVLANGGAVREELTFSDRATSGAGTDRPGYERMMRLVANKPREIDVIVIEDLSRLSRAAADLFTVQRLFEFLEVRLIGIADGIDTFAKHSTLTFGLKSLVSTIYINDLRDKTLRGLEGRALAGFATGGVAFGYRLSKECGPDGKSIGTKIDINAEHAAVLRRIFALYVGGNSFAGIAKTLNAEKVSPPRVFAKNRRVGWKDSTIRAMLHNESYVGRWRYRSSQWRKVPGTNRRVPVRHDSPEAIVSERPELRIVDQELWEATQERLKSVHRFYTRSADGSPKGRAIPGVRSAYLFSSLLCCGVCGGKMTIGGGSKDAYYRCEGHKKRGTCDNAMSVRESVLRAGLLDELRRRLVSDQGLSYARKRLAERLGELTRERDGTLNEERQRLDKLVRHIDQLVDFVADGYGTAAVAEKLRGLERAADAQRSKVAVLERRAETAIRLPSPDELIGIVFDLQKRLSGDTTQAREELRRIFRDGKITLLPQPAGFYVARSEILPMVLLTLPPPADSSSEEVGEGRYPASSCAGAQRGLHTAYHWRSKSGSSPERRASLPRMSSSRPHPALRSRVMSIDVSETDGGTSIILPSTAVVLGFQFRGRVRAGEEYLALAGVTGIQPTAKAYSYEAKTGSLLVRFTPEGATCLGVPVAELTGHSVALDAILPRARVEEAHEQIGEATNTATRIAVVERLLAELPYEDDPLVTRAATLLADAHDEVGVSAIARVLGVSERQLERRFLARIGVTPKRFATLHRFERAIARASTAPSLTAAALDAGYYDQSHFNRDFRRFAGSSPREHFARTR